MKKNTRASGGVGLPVTMRYVTRHARRSFAGTLLALLLAAFLVGTVGQMARLRTHYAELLSSVEVDVHIFNGPTYEKAKALEASGYLRDPIYLKSFDEVNAEIYTPITLVFTNRIDALFPESITWLEGWDEEGVMSTAGKYCLMPAPFMESMGFQLGDAVRVNEKDCLYNLLSTGQYPLPKSNEDEFALRDAHRPKLTIVGRIETTNTQNMVVLNPESFRYLNFLGYTLKLDSAAYKLCSYYDAEEFRDYASKMLLSKKGATVYGTDTTSAPVFRMDTTDADRINRSHQLLNAMFPISVAAALILGTLLPILMVLQSRQEVAVFRALGWPKGAVTLRYVLEQGLLCLVGILIAFVVLPAINGGDLSVLRPVLLIYALVHLLAAMAGIAFASRLTLAKSPMALLQAKE